ncbi:MAG: rhodanese-related sulfurtransferase [Cryomorphaceae bacterium]|nr:MAG: rhodanese-related sulfurtransferase [Cryomorphaceae bacterium]
MDLYNKLSKKDRIKLIEKAGEKRFTLSFYKYELIKNLEIFRNFLFVQFNSIDVLGRIYIANEGINAQLSLPAKNIYLLKKILDEISFLKNVRLNIAIEHDNQSFLKLKIKIRDKIVADGLGNDEYNLKNNGIHVNASEFNELLNDKNTIAIDMRNHYESEIGHFEGANLPDVDTFRESLPIINKKYSKHKKDKKILMYCTGGIRCEKASAYLMQNGYENVFQLDGGIIEYTRQVKSQDIQNKFIGKNFVFDNRRSERISQKIISKCHQCGSKCDDHVNCNNEACHLLFIQCEKCRIKYNGCCSTDCEEIYRLPVDDQKKLRKGKKNSNKIFKKGRFKHKVFK